MLPHYDLDPAGPIRYLKGWLFVKMRIWVRTLYMLGLNDIWEQSLVSVTRHWCRSMTRFHPKLEKGESVDILLPCRCSYEFIMQGT